MSHKSLPDLSSCSDEASSLGLTLHSESGTEFVRKQTRCLETQQFLCSPLLSPSKCFQIAQHCRESGKASANSWKKWGIYRGIPYLRSSYYCLVHLSAACRLRCRSPESAHCLEQAQPAEAQRELQRPRLAVRRQHGVSARPQLLCSAVAGLQGCCGPCRRSERASVEEQLVT